MDGLADVDEAAVLTEGLRINGILRVLLRLNVKLSPFLPRPLPNTERTERIPPSTLLQPGERRVLFVLFSVRESGKLWASSNLSYLAEIHKKSAYLSFCSFSGWSM